MITCTRRIQFCAGHRVMGHENKCAHLHGHNYVALITAQAEQLDGIGRVIDFSVLKDKLGGWIDQYWDHGFILYGEDQVALDALKHFVEPQKLYCLPTNPTAENLADYLLRVIGPQELASSEVRLTKVIIWETENCHAEATLDAPSPVNGTAERKVSEEEDEKFICGTWIDDPDEYFKLWAEYKASRKWAKKKIAVAQRSGGMCERCRKNAAKEVHHKSYDKKFDEPLEDLEHLCRHCHKFVSGKSDYDPKSAML